MWDANSGLAFTSANRFTAGAHGLRSGHPSKNARVRVKHDVLPEKYDMDGRQHSAMGVLLHPFYNQMCLYKAWVANRSLASTSAVSLPLEPRATGVGPESKQCFEGSECLLIL